MDARRHQEIARAFRARRCQDRGLELEEALLLHPPPQRVDDGAALHDVTVQPLAPQVEKAVFQADVLGIFLVAEHRHRQFARRPQHLDIGGEDLDGAGRQIRVLVVGRTPPHQAVDPHDPFGTQLLRGLEGRQIRVGHHLGEPVMVAQVDEQHAAVVADAVTPARKPDGGTDLLGAQRAAIMGTIPMHQGLEGAPASPARIESCPCRSSEGEAAEGQGLAEAERNGNTQLLPHLAIIADVIRPAPASKATRGAPPQARPAGLDRREIRAHIFAHKLEPRR